MEEVDFALVIDNGTSTIKAGFSGDDSPKAVVLNIVGRVKNSDLKEFHVGDEALCRCGILRIIHPMEEGVVTSWDDMERVWMHTLWNKLRVDPAEHTVLVTESPLNLKASREAMTKIMFESFNVPAFCVVSQPVLALYACGSTTGVVLDSGESVTHAAPVFEGCLVRHAIQRIPIGGNNLTSFMLKFLQTRTHTYREANRSSRAIAAHMKEKLAYVALDFESESRKHSESSTLTKEYELPDGNLVPISKEQFHCAEVLFNPALANIPECRSCQRHQQFRSTQCRTLHCLTHFRGGTRPSISYLEHTPYLRHHIMNFTYPPLDTTSTDLHCPSVTCRAEGVHHALHAAITRCPTDIRKALGHTITLSGGNTLFPGLSERIKKEMRVLMPTVDMEVVAPKDNLTAWVGGSILASLDTMKRMCITHEEYDDYGPGIVHRKCA